MQHLPLLGQMADYTITQNNFREHWVSGLRGGLHSRNHSLGSWLGAGLSLVRDGRNALDSALTGIYREMIPCLTRVRESLDQFEKQQKARLRGESYDVKQLDSAKRALARLWKELDRLLQGRSWEKLLDAYQNLFSISLCLQRMDGEQLFLPEEGGELLRDAYEAINRYSWLSKLEREVGRVPFWALGSMEKPRSEEAISRFCHTVARACSEGRVTPCMVHRTLALWCAEGGRDVPLGSLELELESRFSLSIWKEPDELWQKRVATAKYAWVGSHCYELGESLVERRGYRLCSVVGGGCVALSWPNEAALGINEACKERLCREGSWDLVRAESLDESGWTALYPAIQLLARVGIETLDEEAFIDLLRFISERNEMPSVPLEEVLYVRLDNGRPVWNMESIDVAPLDVQRMERFLLHLDPSGERVHFWLQKSGIGGVEAAKSLRLAVSSALVRLPGGPSSLERDIALVMRASVERYARVIAHRGVEISFEDILGELQAVSHAAWLSDHGCIATWPEHWLKQHAEAIGDRYLRREEIALADSDPISQKRVKRTDLFSAV